MGFTRRQLAFHSRHSNLKNTSRVLRFQVVGSGAGWTQSLHTDGFDEALARLQKTAAASRLGRSRSLLMSRVVADVVDHWEGRIL